MARENSWLSGTPLLPSLTGKWAHFKVRAPNACVQKPPVLVTCCCWVQDPDPGLLKGLATPLSRTDVTQNTTHHTPHPKQDTHT